MGHTTTSPIRLITGPPGSPMRHWAWEPAIEPAAWDLLVAKAPGAWALFGGFGYSGGIDCLPVSREWAKLLRSGGITVRMLRAGTIDGSAADGGGYLRDPGAPPDGHAWLAVGAGFWLFDPTWAQYRRSGPADLSRYLLPGGQPFAAWRTKALVGRV